MLVSCDDTNGSSSGETKEMVLLDFDSGSTMSKGLTGFPTNLPFLSMYLGDTAKNEDTAIANSSLASQLSGIKNNFWMSCNAMSTLPMIPSLIKTTANPQTRLTNLKSKNLYCFGFPMEVDWFKVTSDGYFIRYNIIEKTASNVEKTIGIIDYYYSWKDQAFSYREIVTPFFWDYMGSNRETRTSSGSGTGDSLICFELIDVPVISFTNNVAHFAAGEAIKGSSTHKNIYKLYKIMFNMQSNNKYAACIRVSDMLITNELTSNGLSSTIYNVGVNIEATAECELNKTNFEALYTAIENYEPEGKKLSNYGDGYVYLNNDTYNMDFGWVLMAGAFNNVDDIKTTSNFKSFSEYNDGYTLSLLESVSDKLSKKDGMVSACAYNLKGNYGATIANNIEVIGPESNSNAGTNNSICPTVQFGQLQTVIAEGGKIADGLLISSNILKEYIDLYWIKYFAGNSYLLGLRDDNKPLYGTALSDYETTQKNNGAYLWYEFGSEFLKKSFGIDKDKVKDLLAWGKNTYIPSN